MSSSTNRNNKNEAVPMNINKRLGIPNNIAVTGKRKRNNSNNKPIKRRDMSMVADVSRISTDKVNITLPRRIVNDLKMINAKSSQERVEYAGKIDFKTSINNYPQVRFNLPNQLTSHQRGLISNELASLITGYYVTYHTHPAAKSRVNNHNCNNKTRKKLFTLPSGLDFETYVKMYPSMQANIIADAYGYYVIDIIEASERNGFNPNVFNIYLRTDTNPRSKTHLARTINEAMEGIRNLEFMRIRHKSIDGMEYFESTITEWKYTINTELNTYMKDKFGVSVKYYCYGDDPAVITLKRR
jgi:hypothetical protein